MISGDPHWDDELWATMGHLYVGGIWLKKIDVIAREQGRTRQELRERVGNGCDFRSQEMTYRLPGGPIYWDGYVSASVQLAKLLDTKDYFFLPATGAYENLAEQGYGRLHSVGIEGRYWTSTPTVGIQSAFHHETTTCAGALHFSKNGIVLYQIQWRSLGAKNWETR